MAIGKMSLGVFEGEMHRQPYGDLWASSPTPHPLRMDERGNLLGRDLPRTPDRIARIDEGYETSRKDDARKPATEAYLTDPRRAPLVIHNAAGESRIIPQISLVYSQDDASITRIELSDGSTPFTPAELLGSTFGDSVVHAGLDERGLATFTVAA